VSANSPAGFAKLNQLLLGVFRDLNHEVHVRRFGASIHGPKNGFLVVKELDVQLYAFRQVLIFQLLSHLS